MYDKFFADMFTEEESDVVVIGVANDEDGKKYIDSIRNESWFIETFDIDKKKNLFEKKICDIGDINDYDKLSKKLQETISKGKVPLVITKSDMASYHACKNLKYAKVISFDAHSDLLDEYEDEKIEHIDGFSDGKLNCSTWMRRISEIVGNENVAIFGLRSIGEDLMKYVEENKILHLTPREIEDNIDVAKDQVSIFTEGEKIWINLDMDCFDPSIAPSVDHPEPGGIRFREFCDLISAFRGKIIGITLCGGNPMEGSVTEFLAVHSVFQLLSKI